MAGLDDRGQDAACRAEVTRGVELSRQVLRVERHDGPGVPGLRARDEIVRHQTPPLSIAERDDIQTWNGWCGFSDTGSRSLAEAIVFSIADCGFSAELRSFGLTWLVRSC